MNDDELITAVRESFAEVHSTTPVEQIVTRSRVVRALRRIPRVAGAAAVATAAALAATTLVPASHQPSVQLAAWTVTRQADGNIAVTIRELRDAAGLQRRLRADGIPARVTFDAPTEFGFSPRRRSIEAQFRSPLPCRPYLYHQDVPFRQQPLAKVLPSGPPNVLIIRPSALPPGTGLLISEVDIEPPLLRLLPGKKYASGSVYLAVYALGVLGAPLPTLLRMQRFQPPSGGVLDVTANLVQASHRCTGS